MTRMDQSDHRNHITWLQWTTQELASSPDSPKWCSEGSGEMGSCVCVDVRGGGRREEGGETERGEERGEREIDYSITWKACSVWLHWSSPWLVSKGTEKKGPKHTPQGKSAILPGDSDHHPIVMAPLYAAYSTQLDSRLCEREGGREGGREERKGWREGGWEGNERERVKMRGGGGKGKKEREVYVGVERGPCHAHAPGNCLLVNCRVWERFHVPAKSSTLNTSTAPLTQHSKT